MTTGPKKILTGVPELDEALSQGLLAGELGNFYGKTGATATEHLSSLRRTVLYWPNEEVQPEWVWAAAAVVTGMTEEKVTMDSLKAAMQEEDMAVLRGVMDGTYLLGRKKGKFNLLVEAKLNSLGLIEPDAEGHSWDVTEKGALLLSEEFLAGAVERVTTVHSSEVTEPGRKLLDDLPETGVGTTEHTPVPYGTLELCYADSDGKEWRFSCPMQAGITVKLHYLHGDEFTLMKTHPETGVLVEKAQSLGRPGKGGEVDGFGIS